MPNQFQTVIESNIKNLLKENYTEEVREYYDFVNNRALVIKYSNYGTEKQYFLYDTFELITVKGILLTVTNQNNLINLINKNLLKIYHVRLQI